MILNGLVLPGRTKSKKRAVVFDGQITNTTQRMTKKDGLAPSRTVIDYAICTTSFLHNVLDLEVCNDVRLHYKTEHAPIRVSIAVHAIDEGISYDNDWKQLPPAEHPSHRFQMDTGDEVEFAQSVNNAQALLEIGVQLEDETAGNTDESLSNIYQKLEDLIMHHAKSHFNWMCNGILRKKGEHEPPTPEEVEGRTRNMEKRKKKKDRYTRTESDVQKRLRTELAHDTHDVEFQQLKTAFKMAEMARNDRVAIAAGHADIPALQNAYRRAYRAMNRRAAHLVTKRKIGEVEHWVKMFKRDPREAWRVLKKYRTSECKATGTDIHPNVWRRHWAKVWGDTEGCLSWRPQMSERQTEAREFVNQLWEDDFFTDLMNEHKAHVEAMDKTFEEDFSLAELREAASRLNSNSAPGSDGIGAPLIKAMCNLRKDQPSGATTFEDIMLTIFNRCLHTGAWPEAWDDSDLILVKKGGKSGKSPDDYRGVTLLKVCSKWLMQIVDKRIRDASWTEDCQYGFVRGGSCDSALFVLTRAIEQTVYPWGGAKFHKKDCLSPEQKRHRMGQYLSSGHVQLDNEEPMSPGKAVQSNGCPGIMFAAFIDYKKAFPLVDRQILLHKMGAKKEIDPRLTRVMGKAIRRPLCTPKMGNYCLPRQRVKVGLREGAVESPLGWALFYDGVQQHLNDRANRPHGPPTTWTVRIGERTLRILCYADDTILLCSSEQELIDQLDALGEWCNSHNITMSPKSKAMIFHDDGLWTVTYPDKKLALEEGTEYVHLKYKHTGGTIRLDATSMGGHEVKWVCQYKYLGILYDHNASWTTMRTNQIIKARKAISMLCGTLTVAGQIPHKLLNQLAQAFVENTLLYGAEIWGTSQTKDLHTIILDLSRSIFQLGQRSARAATELIANTDTIEPALIARRTRLIIKAATSPINNPLRTAIEHMRTNGSDWMAETKDILSAVDVHVPYRTRIPPPNGMDRPPLEDLSRWRTSARRDNWWIQARKLANLHIHGPQKPGDPQNRSPDKLLDETETGLKHAAHAQRLEFLDEGLLGLGTSYRHRGAFLLTWRRLQRAKTYVHSTAWLNLINIRPWHCSMVRLLTGEVRLGRCAADEGGENGTDGNGQDGQHMNPPDNGMDDGNRRLCAKCLKKEKKGIRVREDEEHILLRCPATEKYRQRSDIKRVFEEAAELEQSLLDRVINNETIYQGIHGSALEFVQTAGSLDLMNIFALKPNRTKAHAIARWVHGCLNSRTRKPLKPKVIARLKKERDERRARGEKSPPKKRQPRQPRDPHTETQTKDQPGPLTDTPQHQSGRPGSPNDPPPPLAVEDPRDALSPEEQQVVERDLEAGNATVDNIKKRRIMPQGVPVDRGLGMHHRKSGRLETRRRPTDSANGHTTATSSSDVTSAAAAPTSRRTRPRPDSDTPTNNKKAKKDNKKPGSPGSIQPAATSTVPDIRTSSNVPLKRKSIGPLDALRQNKKAKTTSDGMPSLNSIIGNIQNYKQRGQAMDKDGSGPRVRARTTPPKKKDRHNTPPPLPRHLFEQPSRSASSCANGQRNTVLAPPLPPPPRCSRDPTDKSNGPAPVAMFVMDSDDDDSLKSHEWDHEDPFDQMDRMAGAPCNQENPPDRPTQTSGTPHDGHVHSSYPMSTPAIVRGHRTPTSSPTPARSQASSGADTPMHDPTPIARARQELRERDRQWMIPSTGRSNRKRHRQSSGHAEHTLPSPSHTRRRLMDQFENPGATESDVTATVVKTGEMSNRSIWTRDATYGHDEQYPPPLDSPMDAWPSTSSPSWTNSAWNWFSYE